MNMEDLHNAVKLGMAAGKTSREYGAIFKNPFPVDTLENEAFEAGYENDLFAWMNVRSRGLEAESLWCSARKPCTDCLQKYAEAVS